MLEAERSNRRRRSRRRPAKDFANLKSASLMEPTDSDSKEDSDYSPMDANEEGSESAEEIYDKSDGEPSDLSGD